MMGAIFLTPENLQNDLLDQNHRLVIQKKSVVLRADNTGIGLLGKTNF